MDKDKTIPVYLKDRNFIESKQQLQQSSISDSTSHSNYVKFNSNANTEDTCSNTDFYLTVITVCRHCRSSTKNKKKKNCLVRICNTL